MGDPDEEGQVSIALEHARGVLSRGEARELAALVRDTSHNGPAVVARAILAHFEGRTTKGIAWTCGMEEGEAFLAFGRLRSLAGDLT